MTLVSAIIPFCDKEEEVAATVRGVVQVRDHLKSLLETDVVPGLEIVAVDERSGDNTLSVLSVLHAQVEGLRTLQDAVPGTAISRAASVARGDVWLLVDHPVDPELAAWGVTQVLRGRCAALVPGELVVVGRERGVRRLRQLRGGLVAAQGAIQADLKPPHDVPACCPPPTTSLIREARLLMRGRLAQWGLGRFDRP